MLFPNVRSEGVKINTINSTATQYAGTKEIYMDRARCLCCWLNYYIETLSKYRH